MLNNYRARDDNVDEDDNDDAHGEGGEDNPPQDVRRAIHAAPRNNLFVEATSQHQNHGYSNNHSGNSNGIDWNVAIIGTATNGDHNTSARTGFN